MSSRYRGELRIQQQTYVVVPTEEFVQLEVESFRKALGIPNLDMLWVGYLIRQHRMRMSMTQAELGNRIGTDQKHIDKIENGTIRRPKDQLLRRLIAVFGEDFKLGLGLIHIILPKEQTAD